MRLLSAFAIAVLTATAGCSAARPKEGGSGASPDVAAPAGGLHEDYQAYKKLLSPAGEIWDEAAFTKLFSPYSVSFGGRVYEMKTDGDVSKGTAGVSLDKNELVFRTGPENDLSILTLREPFRNSRGWRIQTEFKINAYHPSDPGKPRVMEPAFFTMSDSRHSGFLVVWPDLIQFWDLATAYKHGEWRLPRDIADRFVSLDIRKSAGGLLTIMLDGSKYQLDRMDDAPIDDGNCEIPVFVRYTALNTLGLRDPGERAASGRVPMGKELGSEFAKKLFQEVKTRNFFRFGSVYYPDLREPLPVMIIRYLRVQG